MTVVRLQHVSVQVPHEMLERCSAFYRDVLGMESIHNLAGLAWFRFGDGDHVHLLGGNGNTSQAHLALQVDDLAATLTRIHADGGDASRGDDLWGQQRWFTRDPAGNLIELFEVPPPDY